MSYVSCQHSSSLSGRVLVYKVVRGERVPPPALQICCHHRAKKEDYLKMSMKMARLGFRAMPLRRAAAFHASAVARAGDGGFVKSPPPPMVRYQPPNYRLEEQHDLVWDDGVAAETILDFDSPNISTAEAVGMWLGAFGCLYLVYLAIKLYDPASKNPVYPRVTRTDNLGYPTDE